MTAVNSNIVSVLGFADQLHHSGGRCQDEFNPALNDDMKWCHVDEDFTNPNAVYKLPVSPDHMTTVTDAYSASISKRSNVFCNQQYFILISSVVSGTKVLHFCSTPSEYLDDHGKNYLKVVALHEMGNLQFYTENTRSVSVGLSVEASAAFCTFMATIVCCVFL